MINLKEYFYQLNYPFQPGFKGISSQTKNTIILKSIQILIQNFETIFKKSLPIIPTFILKYLCQIRVVYYNIKKYFKLCLICAINICFTSAMNIFGLKFHTFIHKIIIH